MALSSSINAYTDCLEFLERSLDEARGARIWFHTEGEANHWRMRCNQARKLHREQNKRSHEVNTKMWGVSEYDPLVMTVREGSDEVWWVYAQKMELAANRVEAIPEDEGMLTLEGVVVQHLGNGEVAE